MVAGLLAGPSAAQDVTEPSLKAAFVYNMAKFVEWPADVLPAGAPLMACVAGDPALARALERTVEGRAVMGHPVSVKRVASGPAPRGCHLLYAGGLAASQVAPIVASARGTALLTVVDLDAAARAPGVVHLFVENGKLRFNLDHGLAKRSRLQLSAQFIKLAKRVYDDSDGGAP